MIHSGNGDSAIPEPSRSDPSATDNTDAAERTSGRDADIRRLVLAVSVTYDVDIATSSTGAALPGPHTHQAHWADLDQCAAAVVDPADKLACIYSYLQVHSIVASLGCSAAPTLRSRFRAMALPFDHPLHPGDDWVQETVPGGVLTRGLGLHGVLGDSDMTVPLPPQIAALARIKAESWWQEASDHAEEMAGLMLTRIHRDRGKQPAEPVTLRPMGGVDVLALLATNRLRRGLTNQDSTGLRAVAVPDRTRGWVDLHRIDPVFVQPAWAACDVFHAGHPKAFLVTEAEVGCSHRALDPGSFLREEAVDVRPWGRAHRYR